MNTNNSSNQDPQPLSWFYARARLRHILQKYVDEISSSTTHSETTISVDASFSARAIDKNLDLYFGLLLSLSILILATFSLSGKQGGDGGSALNPNAQLAVYRSQLAGAVLLTAGSLFGLWIVRRSTFLRANDSDKAKKREVLKFLKEVRRLESEMGDTEDWPPLQPKNFPTSLSETALCDIYPVYRQLTRDPPRFLWTRLPSLLLVEGDYVALQIGDTCPADCLTLESPEVNLNAGDQVSLEALGETAAGILSEIPRGRTSLPEMSERLLLLCNNVRIFCVKRAPIHDFIQSPSVPLKPSQVWRKMRSVRVTLLFLVPFFLILSALFVLSRPDITKTDLSLSLPLPLMAPLGVVPLVTPCFSFFLEVIGTSRILRNVHSQSEDASKTPQNSAMLLLRYILATSLTRLSLWAAADIIRRYMDKLLALLRQRPGQPSPYPMASHGLLRVPPASSNLLEKLGLCTAFALVDDELAYELNAIPQQLLIPSGHGLKLLDLCPVYDDDSSIGSGSESLSGRHRNRNPENSDSDSEDEQRFHSTLRQKILKRRVLRRRSVERKPFKDDGECSVHAPEHESAIEVQFEDPSWWKHLPALKCIGLSCLAVEDRKADDFVRQQNWFDSPASSIGTKSAKAALVNLIIAERRSGQLSALAECIGFSLEPNANGKRGDLTPFEEQLRLQVISKSLLLERLSLDSHERSSEQSRWWGHLRADSTSVIVKDKRTGAYQLLTVGDPHVVANLCNEAWQGEISTILPLGQVDRQTIADTSRNWKLADLDVAAFGYAPVPHSLEQRLKEGTLHSEVFLLDAANNAQSILKDKTVSRDWALIRNQVFLGVLGSLVVPRREIPKLLSVLNDAGVRFVYFSPRNMRRQKELASQMGIDVSWNCAISLRPLVMGEDDPHRMTSAYADWDVNAKLPHGVDEVRRHLSEVDNVPLLVSLYTDTTKTRTREMVEVFQEYHDTVMVVGIAHLPKNDGIFSVADIAVGIDVLGYKSIDGDSPADRMMVSELEFVSAIVSHSCEFRFRGVTSLSYLPSFIEQGRAALEAATSAAVFLVCSSLSFSFYVVFATCAVSTTLPHVPAVGAVVYLQMLLPLVGLSMAMTTRGEKIMKQVPSKNDSSQTFAPKEGFLLYQMVLLKSLIAALLPQILWLIAFGSIVIEMEPDLIQSKCGGADNWVKVIRCEALRNYSGPARVSAGVSVFSVFVVTNMTTSISFVSRFEPIGSHQPWERNVAWVVAVMVAVAVTGLVAGVATEDGTGAALPWYFYFIAICNPLICVLWDEYCKREEAKREIRAEKLRRLQFETRLGMWSPKN